MQDHRDVGPAPRIPTGRGCGRWRAAACALVLGLLLGSCRGEDDSALPEATSAADLSAACEAALVTRLPNGIRLLAWSYRPSGRVPTGGGVTVGRVVGVAWAPETQEVFVADGFANDVKVFNAEGGVERTIGRRGGGPGEFEEIGGAHGSRPVYNQVATVGPGHVAVQDFRALHVFSADGLFVDRVPTGGALSGPFGVRHLAPWTDSSVLFAETGAMLLEQGASAERRKLRLLEATVRRGRIDTSFWGDVSSSLDRLPPFSGFPPSDAYAWHYARTWDAVPGLLAVVSFHRHGICFMDRTGVVQGAYRLGAPVLPVDDGEKRRILDALVERFGPRTPTGTSWEDEFDFWPSTVPFYTDVMLSRDSTAWVERPIDGGRRVADLFHAARGYLGSLELLWPRLPRAGMNGCLLVVTEHVNPGSNREEDYYGLERWCPVPVEAAAQQPAPPPLPAEPPVHYDSLDAASVLRVIVAAQAAHFSDHGRFAASAAALGFEPSQAIRMTFFSADGGGYAVVASNATIECAFYHGSAKRPRDYVRAPDAIECARHKGPDLPPGV